MVHLAYDRSVDDNTDRKVALKFMKHKEQFVRELEVRQGAAFSDEYVINVIRTIDGEEEYETDFINKGFDDYRFLIVMTAGDRSLAAVIASEHIAGGLSAYNKEEEEEEEYPLPLTSPHITSYLIPLHHITSYNITSQARSTTRSKWRRCTSHHSHLIPPSPHPSPHIISRNISYR